MRFAMTGATGFLGTELARQMREAGHDVVALVRAPSKAAHLGQTGVELVAGDLDDIPALDRLLESADGFFHVAGWYRHGRREHARLRAANIDGTRHALEAAKRSGVPKVVYTSTIALNSDTHGAVPDESYRFTGRHLSEYDRTKAVAHGIAQEYADAGLPLVIVQPSSIYGPGDTGSAMAQLLRRVVQGKIVVGPRGGGSSVTHVADVARGHVLAMEAGLVGESYILAAQPVTYEELFATVARLAGTRGPVLLPPAVVRAAARLTSPIEAVLPVPQYLTAEAARSALATYFGDSTKARRELGWTSRPLEEGLAATVAFLKRS